MAASKKASEKKTEPDKGRRRSPRSRGRGAGVEATGAHRNGFTLQDDGLEAALISGEHRDLLEDYFGEDVYAELNSLATQSRRVQVRGGPRVLVLPGIMGSKLGRPRKIFDDIIWIDPIDVIAGGLDQLIWNNGDGGIEALGVILFAYLKLKLRLRLAGFDADFHPFDWRRNIRDLGNDLAKRIRQETLRTGPGPDDGGGPSNQPRETIVPLYLVAHSMGGLVSRAALHRLEADGHGGCVSRLVMLGTPNYGSFAPVRVLSGYDATVRKLAALDLQHDEKQLVNDILSSFVGLYQMLPAPDRFTGIDLYQPGTWPPTGIAPRPDILQAAPSIHQHLAPNDDRFVLIAGVNQDTVVGVRRSGDGFVFLQSPEGDGTVPLALAQLDGVKTYFVEEGHGSLPNNGDVAKAVIDILETGATAVLQETWTPRRRGEVREVGRDQLAPEPFGSRTGEAIHRQELRHLLDEFAAPAAAGVEAPRAPLPELSALSREPIVVGRRRQGRFDLRLARGDITQVDTRAVVIGLFNGVAPGGPANAIDAQLDYAIRDFTERRMISARAGEVFIMPSNRYRTGTDMVVFAGMGSYDLFSEEVLRVVGENVARALVRTKVDQFATVMLGMGSGLTLEDLLRNLIHGFLRGVRDAGARSGLRAVTFCERDPERFERMHQEILRLSHSSLFDETEVTVEAYELPPPPPPPPGARRGGSGMPVAYLMVREVPDRFAQSAGPAEEPAFVLRASLLTAGSRSTVVTDSKTVDLPALNHHLEDIEKSTFGFDGMTTFGRELGEMVLPDLVRQALHELRTHHLVVINDARTSRIPWETLRIGDGFPAAEAGISRKYEAEDLTVAKWLEERRLDSELNVLLIVNPTLDLPGADKEGERIKEILDNQAQVKVDALWREQATLTAIRAAFRTGSYDVVHYAGHAYFDPLNRARSGILCHGRQVLSGVDLAALERLPAVMFFNACESGRVRSPEARQQGEATARRLETNVGFAEALLRAGVGNYIGTYWPVQDQSAMMFGEILYRQLVAGESLGTAIQQGRSALFDHALTDWADYILYGSPDFVVKRRE
jgi:pimeloyl-ACP methyl ester carboxylesterase